MTKSTAYVDGLYAYSEPLPDGIEKDAVETKFLQQVDDDAAKVRAKMLRGNEQLSVDERSAWTRFLMAMRARQPKMVSRFRVVGTEEARRSFSEAPIEYEALKQSDDPPTLEQWVSARFPGTIENTGMSVFVKHILNEEIGNKLIRLSWIRWKFDDARHELLLSDNPLVFTGGIDAPELLVGLPLSPTRMFFAYRGDQVIARMRRTRPDDLAKLVNESIVGQASERVYARNTGPQRFIRKTRARIKVP